MVTLVKFNAGMANKLKHWLNMLVALLQLIKLYKGTCCKLKQNTNRLLATNLLAAAVAGNCKNGATLRARHSSNMLAQLLPLAVKAVSV